MILKENLTYLMIEIKMSHFKNTNKIDGKNTQLSHFSDQNGR